MYKTLLLTILHLIILHTSFSQSLAPSHDLFNSLLKQHVTAEGKVDYKGFIKDSITLNHYLKILSNNPPDSKRWTREERMAYLINAYNAFTVKLIIQHYPIKSIKDIGSSFQIPFVNTPWDIKFIRIGKEIVDLNALEHGMLRKQFDDPRIHMALVCASKSCPILLNEAYDPKRLNAQLDKQAKAFLADPFRNQINTSQARLSMIFKWYGMDFNKGGKSVRTFINTHSSVQLNPQTKISYLDYDWALNE